MQPTSEEAVIKNDDIMSSDEMCLNGNQSNFDAKSRGTGSINFVELKPNKLQRNNEADKADNEMDVYQIFEDTYESLMRELQEQQRFPQTETISNYNELQRDDFDQGELILVECLT